MDDNKPNNKIKIIVLNCMSSIAYEFNGDTVTINDHDRPYIFSLSRVTKTDSAKFVNIAKKICLIKTDEVLDNACINDGFHLKIYLEYNGNKKKIFIGNYYDARIDSLLSIFDKYIDRNNEILKYNAFSYGHSKEYIQEMKESQKLCDFKTNKEMKQHLLNVFCEDKK